tara:strand:+ start:168 stop:383 length:216 start_codon:yes stop_codon:yes gene_type:complete
MALQHGSQAIEFIDRKIHELELEINMKKEEAESKGWSSYGKKYQAINEMERHKWSLKYLRTILSEKHESGY